MARASLGSKRLKKESGFSSIKNKSRNIYIHVRRKSKGCYKGPNLED